MERMNIARSLGFTPTRRVSHSRQIPCSNAPNNKQTHLELPGGALWWLNVNQGTHEASENSNSLALIKQQQNHSLTVRPQNNPTSLALSGMMVIDTDFELVEEHLRRTRRLLFTCNLCGQSNIKHVNPLAWDKGSVFARCDGCDVVHKLKDNLNIFHELQGPVFPPKHLRSSFLVQEILDKIAEARKKNDMNSQ